LGVDDRVEVFDGAGRQAEGVICSTGAQSVEIQLGSEWRTPRPSGPSLRLLVGLLKADKMEWVVQKATELGVDEIWPVETSRSVPRLPKERRARRQGRLLRIAQEAARQSGQPFVPRVRLAEPLEAALGQLGEGDLGFVFWEAAPKDRQHRLWSRLSDLSSRAEALSLLVGPEGGLEVSEVDLACSHGLEVVSLGAAVLRAETAAIAAVVLADASLGRLG